ncbi:uncharacterized protein LOC131854449 [Achroia grisella]|uniref:uncharacterized protein LOC131854449 n=1 Tax=Achroia grisella TaxID=688607 RepID=UPI0027D29372|nr:uncharacterized protein LOC131854449 [Achroia grisella]
MNDVIKVATLHDCDDNSDRDAIRFDPTWRHSLYGCMTIEVLRDMFKFNISYVPIKPNMESYALLLLRNDSVDIYTRPISIRGEILDNVFPLQAIFSWRIGFLLRRQYEIQVLSDFYWQPFSSLLWFSLFIMSFPVETVFRSRRIGYFTFLLFSFIVYSYYTSNLLSRLVIDEDYDMDLETLGESDYKCVLLENIVRGHGNTTDCETALSLDFGTLERINVSVGLEAVRSNKTALLSDFTTVYSEIHKKFNNKEICELIEVDVLSNLKKYIVSSKNFRYKELFKVGISRLHELGLINRFTLRQTLQNTLSDCLGTTPISLDFTHVSSPYFLLGFSYVLSIIIMLGERCYFNRNRLWPYLN